jgi:LEA14-like dessication related protein
MNKKAIFLVVLFVAAAHFSFSVPSIKDLKITVKEKRIRDFSLDGLTLVFYVNIENSSSRDYFLSGYEYRFIVNQTDYLQLQTGLEESIRIEERGETLVAFPVKITYENLFRIIPAMENELHATCNLIGWARFSDGRRERGKLAQLRVNALTLGGADIEFEVKFLNKNRFELLVDRISYTLTLAGYEVEKGTIPGDKNIEKQGEKLFSLPLLLDFFDVGKGVYNVLDKPSTQSCFKGDVEVHTVWGRLTIPFDEQGLLTITRIP